MSKQPKPPSDDNVIFVAFITTKNGKRIYAHQKGLKAFAIKVRNPRKEV